MTKRSYNLKLKGQLAKAEHLFTHVWRKKSKPVRTQQRVVKIQQKRIILKAKAKSEMTDDWLQVNNHA